MAIFSLWYLRQSKLQKHTYMTACFWRLCQKFRKPNHQNCKFFSNSYLRGLWPFQLHVNTNLTEDLLILEPQNHSINNFRSLRFQYVANHYIGKDLTFLSHQSSMLERLLCKEENSVCTYIRKRPFRGLNCLTCHSFFVFLIKHFPIFEPIDLSNDGFYVTWTLRLTNYEIVPSGCQR